jgi:probable phosphomutase (TIGR03848 family)
MTEFLLIRHAVNDWVNTGRLAGWTPHVRLNEHGRNQAAATGERLAKVKLAAIFASPLERTMETAEAIAAHHAALNVTVLDGVGEVRYGEWQGARLSALHRHKLWSTVQNYPSRVQFPDGETIRQAQMRAVNALEELIPRYPKQQVVVVAHSDIIKLILAHYLGMHLDLYQRLDISPASLSIIYLGMDRPYIRCINDTSHLPPPPPSPPQPDGWWQWLKSTFNRGD